MALKNCAACDELRNDASNLVLNGLTDTECTSLKNNTGLNPSSGNNDCTDLHNLNDCLIGNMEDEVDAYDVCDWQPFQKAFIPNVWTTIKGVICAVCGLWTKTERLDCIVSNITEDLTFNVGLDNIEFANGVTPRTSGERVVVPNITGNAYCGYMTGSLKLPSGFASNFPSSSLGEQGVLLYEYRIKMSSFKLRKIYNGNMQENAAGECVHAHIFKFTSNSDTRPYAPGTSGYADYTVPEGWTYLQIRLTSYESLPSSGNITLSGVIPVLMNPKGFDC